MIDYKASFTGEQCLGNYPNQAIEFHTIQNGEVFEATLSTQDFFCTVSIKFMNLKMNSRKYTRRF